MPAFGSTNQLPEQTDLKQALTATVKADVPAVQTGSKELWQTNEKLAEDHHEEVHEGVSELTQSESQELTPAKVTYQEEAQIAESSELLKDSEGQVTKRKPVVEII